MEENQNFSTRDLYLAATLMFLKFPLIGIDFSVEGSKNQPVGYFLFNNSSSIQEARQKYNQGLVSVEPRSFVTMMKTLKSEVSNVFSNPHINSSENKG